LFEIQLILLGAIAGFTIFLGLPLALVRSISQKTKGFLNSVATGILIFLIVDVFGNAWGDVGNAAITAFNGRGSPISATYDALALFGGLALGLLGLALYESKYMNPGIASRERASPQGDAGDTQVLKDSSAYRMAMMIATGIGAHNFSEGLAIGQSYASGAIGLALVLVVGFAAHNATEGFGIAGPLAGLVRRPSVLFLIRAGLVGGGPTFLGTIVGSLWISPVTYIFFLSLAGGALIYVSLLMYGSARRHASNRIVLSGIFIGLCAGFITDLLVTIGGA
jgi:ZIP family zinc transporter